MMENCQALHMYLLWMKPGGYPKKPTSDLARAANGSERGLNTQVLPVKIQALRNSSPLAKGVGGTSKCLLIGVFGQWQL